MKFNIFKYSGKFGKNNVVKLTKFLHDSSNGRQKFMNIFKKLIRFWHNCFIIAASLVPKKLIISSMIRILLPPQATRVVESHCDDAEAGSSFTLGENTPPWLASLLIAVAPNQSLHKDERVSSSV